MLWQQDLTTSGDSIHAAFIVRDSDGIESRREDIERGVADWAAFPVVLAIPHPEVEAWSICGFFPATEPERNRVAAVCADIHFDPTTQSDCLVSTTDDSPKDAKRVLDRLTDGDAHRAGECLRAPTLDHLRARGTRNGLTRFLRELRARVVPLISGVRQPPA